MNRPADVDRTLESWLAEGPSQLPDRVIDGIVRQLDETKQRRPTWLPGRERMNRMIFALGGVAAVVVVAVVGLGLYYNGPSAGSLPSPSPTASPSPTVTPTASPVGLNEPGPFLLWDQPEVGPMRATIPAPGWYGASGGRILTKDDNPDAPDGAGMIVFGGDLLYVYGDPCRWSTTLPDSPVSTVDELVAELGNQPARGASEPVDISVDGYAGKSITIHVPDDAVFSECDRGEFRTLVEDPLTDGARYHQDPGQIDEVWILDVDGVLVVLFAAYYEETPADHIDEMRSIVDSITFGE
jgi:hypothetical protein